ncbi:MAG: gamma carbonic anhydrase family protein [Methanobrevibacter sp.]|jgi:carbonic anhydrase/acetyltransferase-like protein (isoleucine patch superfamily)|nr:gamma carbonic anhydrase family protein [Candidatus Methanovirga basalitermitum]
MKISDSAKIFPGVHVIGDVKISENVSVWYNAVIRGDCGDIKIGKNSNVQDNCVLHSTEGFSVDVHDNVSIGHGAILHGCEIQDNVIVGMNATILNGSKINEDSIVGAGALVTEHKEFPEKSLILGSPAKVVRELSHEEIEIITENANTYVELAKRYK